MKKFLSLCMAAFEVMLVVAIVFALSMFFTGEASSLVLISGSVALLALLLIVNPKGAIYETIPVENVRAAITNSMVHFYQEKTEVKSFLKSLFPVQSSNTKFISVEVQRGTEKLAVDITRGTGSNYNQASKSTMKTILPPYFNEEFSVNELEVYDVAYASLDQGLMRQLAQDQAALAREITNKIERSYEKQRADVLQTGVVTLVNHDSIDFRRKAASMVDDAAQYWSDDSVDPDLAFNRAGKFLREEGKIQTAPGQAYVAILGSRALQSLLNNPIFQGKKDRIHMNLGDIVPANMSVEGASYHGRISVGSYIWDLWSYPEVYELANGTKVPYIDTDTFIATTYKPDFKFVYGMVPQLPGVVSPMAIKEGFWTLEYIDPKMMNHAQRIMSAGVVVPTAIDQMYNQKVSTAS